MSRIMRPAYRSALVGALIVMLFVSAVACTRTVYVPREVKEVEYRDRIISDSVYLRDSVVMQGRNDTMWIEKYRYLYRDKLIRDSVFLRDSISYPVYVDVIKRERYVPKFFKICFWIALTAACIGGVKLWRVIRGSFLKR